MDSDKSKISMEHVMESDWSVESVHVMGIIPLVATGGGLCV